MTIPNRITLDDLPTMTRRHWLCVAVGQKWRKIADGQAGDEYRAKHR